MRRLEVYIASSNASRIQQSVDNLKKKHPGADISGQTCDLSGQNVRKNLENVLESVKLLDHIVFTAGDALAIVPLDNINLEAIHKAGHIRFAIPLLLAKLAPHYLKPGHQSSLTLTTGMGGEKPFPNWSLVAGYLTGLQGLTRNLALDLEPIRVNLVSPGVVDTPLHGPGGVPDEMKGSTALGKVGAPEEAAEVYLYFMKDTNATGSCISSNGGALLL
ncbi:short-chain dehydrogenase [Neofusicoccum parvum]|uniref:Short-chain dehydrogenase n=1 Tax=Neofusicoccum parvum TaxID=310453 RepID=A0ACB5SLY5_9PEZI|nr:short-chain dehydrogenase [Neofusicoccum parvum]